MDQACLMGTMQRRERLRKPNGASRAACDCLFGGLVEGDADVKRTGALLLFFPAAADSQCHQPRFREQPLDLGLTEDRLLHPERGVNRDRLCCVAIDRLRDLFFFVQVSRLHPLCTGTALLTPRFDSPCRPKEGSSYLNRLLDSIAHSERGSLARREIALPLEHGARSRSSSDVDLHPPRWRGPGGGPQILPPSAGSRGVRIRGSSTNKSQGEAASETTPTSIASMIPTCVARSQTTSLTR